MVVASMSHGAEEKGGPTFNGARSVCNGDKMC